MNIELTDQSELSHDEAVLLLPWLVNGSLANPERLRLLNHVGTCAACRSEIMAVRQLYAHLHTENVAIPDPHQGLERFRQQHVAQRPDRLQTREPGLRDRVNRGRRRWRTRPALTWLAAAAVVLLALLPLSYQLRSIQEPHYRTLSDRQEQPAKAMGDVRLIFDSQLGTDQIENLLATAGAQPLGEADAQGVYTVRLTGPNGAKADVPTIIAWLRQQPGVLFAEPTGATAP